MTLVLFSGSFSHAQMTVVLDAGHGGKDPGALGSKVKEKDVTLDVALKLGKSGKRKNRGVQQAGFLVLYKTSMPSVLVELGFLSNKEEEKLMSSEAGQNAIAAALLSAFADYKNNWDQSKTKDKCNGSQNSDSNGKAISTTSGTTYRVQFESRSSKIGNFRSHFKGIDNVEEYFHNGMYKYTAGCFTDKSDADDYCAKLRQKGYSGAFVVKFKDGKRE